MHVRWTRLAIVAFFPGVAFACGLDDSVVEGLSTGAHADGGTGDATLSGDGSSGDDGGGGGTDGGGPTDGGTSAPVLVYANSQTDLFSFDVTSGTLAHLGTFSGCGSPTNLNDIAIDGSGQMYLLQQSDAIYKLASDGTCSDRSPLTMDTGTIDKISGRQHGSPSVVALNGTNNDYYGIDLGVVGTGTTTKINADLFNGTGAYGLFDFACSKSGTCWAALPPSVCGAGAASSCLESFPDDGSAQGTIVSAINVQPSGLAYVGGVLYTFNFDGSISKITLTGSVGVEALPVSVASGTTAPAHWLGAAATSAN